MFWGLIMEPNKRYTQTVEKAFHLSMASLVDNSNSPSLIQVMLCHDNRNYLLCSLQKGSIWQVPLDLNFQEGTKIAFTCNGNGHVHLTGYLIPEDEGLDELDDFEEDEDEEEEDEEVPTLVGQKKRKAIVSPKDKNELKRAKKSKVEEDEDEDEDDDDDDESDSDIEDGILNDSDDDLDEEEDDDEDESDEDDEEEKVETPVKQSKKQKQKQNQSNQQNQQNQQNQNQQQNKKDKNKMVNGKDAKPEKEQGKQKKNKAENKTEDKPEQQQQQKKRTVEGGVQVEDVKVGSGAPAKAGKFVSVYYVGRLQNGKKFDQTQQGEGFKFRLGKGEVIKGWDVGIVGMKVGGKRRIVIPPSMAYGAKGSPPVIPPNSALNFEVELKAVH